MKLEKCKLCDTPTKFIYNINFKAVSVCESCAGQIALQEIKDVLLRASENRKKKKKKGGKK